MTTLLGKDASLDHGEGRGVPHANECVGEPRSALVPIFRSIRADLEAVEARLAATLRATGDRRVRAIVDFLLASPGKRIRPALVLLCAGAVQGAVRREVFVDVAAAVELIHMASLVHDDLIDGATVRHFRASVPAKWGQRAAVSVGAHLCAKAFQLVADCAEPRLFATLGASMAAMCEGELQQVARRGDYRLYEHHCLAVIEKKTASLFQACCGAGALAARGTPATCRALQEYGFHLGIAFQILDDCRDLLSSRQKLGKSPGQDLRAGDVTLPLLYAMRAHRGKTEDRRQRTEDRGQKTEDAAPSSVLGPPSSAIRPPSCVLRYPSSEAGLGEAFRASPAPERMAELVESCVERARQELTRVADSDFRRGLHRWADHIAASTNGILE